MSSAITQFTNNLFGTIAGPTLAGLPANVDFIPVKVGETMDVKDHGANWIGLRSKLMQKYAYEVCYPVSSILDRLAEYDLNGVVEVLRYKGKGKDDYATGSVAQNLNELFTQPNENQAWYNFRGQQLVYKRTFGFCPVLPIYAVGLEYLGPTRMINLPPWLFDVDVTNSEYPYLVILEGKEVRFKKDQIILLTDSFTQDESKHFKLPLSRLIGLDMAVSNICAAMEADNVLLKKKGPLGFISHDVQSKDGVTGYVPMRKWQKRDVQKALQQYGMSWSQYQFAITRAAVKWNPMSFDLKSLQTKETVVAGEKAICHRFNFPYILYEMSDTAYAANGNNAEKNCYTSNVLPNSMRDFAEYNRALKTKENNITLTADFSAVPCLQSDKKTEADALKATTEAYGEQYDRNLITLNEYLTALGRDTVEGGDVYKSANNGTEALATKFGVGGTSSFQSIIADPTLSRATKNSILQVWFGLTPELANQLTKDLKDNEPAPANT